MTLDILTFLLCLHYLMRLSVNFQVVFWTCLWSLSLFVFQSHKTFHVEDATRTQHMPRNVPVAVQQELRQHLQELVNMKVLSPVKEPTKWINSMVIVKKPNKLRICLDPKDLNKAIKRPHYTISTIDYILPQLSKAEVFPVLEAKDGFWQVKLDEPC